MSAALVCNCSCDSVALLRAGRLVCATCSAPVVAVEALPDVYRSDGALARGWSRRRFREAAPKIPGATRLGGRKGRGVVWIVPRADFESWLASKAKRSVAPEKPAAEVVSIDSWIESAGYRQSREADR